MPQFTVQNFIKKQPRLMTFNEMQLSLSVMCGSGNVNYHIIYSTSSSPRH